jgi:hypothetical protein
MIKAVVSPINRIRATSDIETSEDLATRVYQTRKSFAVVQFDQAVKGRIVFLPEGAKLRVVGSSCLLNCMEVLWEDHNYNIFRADLLGIWSSRIHPLRTMAAATGACA